MTYILVSILITYLEEPLKLLNIKAIFPCIIRDIDNVALYPYGGQPCSYGCSSVNDTGASIAAGLTRNISILVLLLFRISHSIRDSSPPQGDIPQLYRSVFCYYVNSAVQTDKIYNHMGV